MVKRVCLIVLEYRQAGHSLLRKPPSAFTVRFDQPEQLQLAQHELAIQLDWSCGLMRRH